MHHFRTRSALKRCGACRRVVLLLSGLCLMATTTLPALAQGSRPVRSAANNVEAAHIAEAAQRFGVPENWIRAVLRAESAGDLRAISSVGAMGLMQIMPDTWADLRIRYRLGNNPYDPRDNILAGTAYLREMWDRYGDVSAMLAAYNAGPGRYDELLSLGGPLPAETRAYVASIASVLRGDRPSQNRSAVARPRDWREAAIFVVQDDGISAVASDRIAGGVRASLPATAKTTTALQQKGLFVARKAGGGRP